MVPTRPLRRTLLIQEGILDGYVSYLVYAVMTNPTDVLSAVFSDNAVLTDGGPLVINAECECYNPTDGTVVWMASNSSYLARISTLGIRYLPDNWEIELGHARRQSFLDV